MTDQKTGFPQVRDFLGVVQQPLKNLQFHTQIASKPWAIKCLKIESIIQKHVPEIYWTAMMGGITVVVEIGKQWIMNKDVTEGGFNEIRNNLRRVHDIIEKNTKLKQIFSNHVDHLKWLIKTCDATLGTSGPILYPKRTIILETLEVWENYTGKNPPRNAIQYNPHSETKMEAAPYALCRAVLTAIEGKDQGDFHGMYETVVRKQFPRK